MARTTYLDPNFSIFSGSKERGLTPWWHRGIFFPKRAPVAPLPIKVKAYNNQIVNSAHYGIAIASGHDNEIKNNRIVDSAQLSDGTHLPGGLGVYIWDFYKNIPLGRFYNNFAENNTIGVMNGGNGQRNDMW